MAYDCIAVWEGKSRIKKALIKISAAVLIAAASVGLGGLAGPALAGEPCPWTISEVGVAKHNNGDKKAETFVKGSFPTNIPGLAERPDWYINNILVGKSQLYGEGRWIPDSASNFKLGDNTVKVKFHKPPFRGASFTCTISLFTWLAVTDGGQRWFQCK